MITADIAGKKSTAFRLCLIRAVLENHTHGTLTQFRGKFARLHSGPIFSRVGAFTKPRLIHLKANETLLTRVQTRLLLHECVNILFDNAVL